MCGFGARYKIPSPNPRNAAHSLRVFPANVRGKLFIPASFRKNKNAVEVKGILDTQPQVILRTLIKEPYLFRTSRDVRFAHFPTNKRRPCVRVISCWLVPASNIFLKSLQGIQCIPYPATLRVVVAFAFQFLQLLSTVPKLPLHSNRHLKTPSKPNGKLGADPKRTNASRRNTRREIADRS